MESAKLAFKVSRKSAKIEQVNGGVPMSIGMTDLDVQNIIDQIKQVSDINELQELKARFLGRQGALTTAMKKIREVSPDRRKDLGKTLNLYKQSIEDALDEQRRKLLEEQKRRRQASRRYDITMPGASREVGALHIISQVQEEVQEIFLSMGFELAVGPEMETAYYNFEALNTPEWHPSRDMHDTFYLSNGMLLRTHTSPVQIRVMEERKPPLAIFSPGRCYRKDTPDATHLPMFYQIEALYVDKNVSVAHLKGTLEVLAKRLFGQDREIRLRPSYFPFTEPSFEVYVSCGICHSSGCRSCGGTGWLEILGAGMVHPNVFRSVSYDPGEWSGFALGMGLERTIMLKYDLEDIRELMRNDRRFIKAFRGVVL